MRAWLVGPPWDMTTSGGRSPAGDSTSGFVGRVVPGMGDPAARGGEGDVPWHRQVGRPDRQPAALAKPLLAAAVQVEPDDRCRLRRRAAHDGDDAVADAHVGQVRGIDLDLAEEARRPGARGARSVPCATRAGHDRAVGIDVDVGRGRRPIAGQRAPPPWERGAPREPPRTPAVEVPPAAAIGDEDERAIGRPAGLRDRLADPTGHVDSLAEQAIGGDGRDPQVRALPGHAWQVPGQEGQPVAFRAEARVGGEVVAPGELDEAAIGKRDGAEQVARQAGRGALVLEDGDDALGGRASISMSAKRRAGSATSSTRRRHRRVAGASAGSPANSERTMTPSRTV